jgi:hypothetical protein
VQERNGQRNGLARKDGHAARQLRADIWVAGRGGAAAPSIVAASEMTSVSRRCCRSTAGSRSGRRKCRPTAAGPRPAALASDGGRVT